ncbi:MAG: diadenylate cyclase [Planctomycetota bacterium]|nr:diadenylate cyclase [Planctomycetota bacterium]
MTWTIFGYSVLETIIELLIIWMSVFLAFRFLQGTRGAGVIRGLMILLVPLWLLQVLADSTGKFERLNFFAEEFLTYVFLLLIIIFQPELRQAAVKVSQSELFARFRRMPSVRGSTIASIAEATNFLSRNQYGALIAIERENSTLDHVIGGQPIDAQISPSLLQSIFWPNNPLHDLGLVLRGDRIIKASVQFPLADESAMLSPNLGSRHRAAVGLSMRCDALIIIVSEETGRISIADQGKLTTINYDDIENEIVARITPTPEQTEESMISTNSESNE